MIQCFLRMPQFPMVCDVGSALVGALSLKEVSTHIATLDLPADASFPVVTASGKGWSFYTQHRVLAPFARKSRWTKREVIAMFNASAAARKLGGQYSEHSLSAKRFDRILTEIVKLIQTANKRPHSST